LEDLAQARELLAAERLTASHLQQEVAKLAVTIEAGKRELALKCDYAAGVETELQWVKEELAREKAQVSQAARELKVEQQRVATGKDQLRVLQMQHDHFKSECEDLQSRGAHMGKRLYELETLCSQQAESLSIIRTENEAFGYVKDQKDIEIANSKVLVAELEDKLAKASRELELQTAMNTELTA